jgi:predicted DNA-binding transcriptional regulator AlpA
MASSADDDNIAAQFGIEPCRLYRTTHQTTRKIIGLKNTAIKEAIKNGSLPPPVSLTAHGKASGWYGFTLIELIKDRLAKAEQRRAAQPHKQKGARP